MNDYLLIIYKCIIFYLVLIIFLRLMGKREVGELSIFDVVVFFIISEFFSIYINNSNSTIFKSIVPIMVIVLLQIIFSYLIMKFRKLRLLFDGKSEFLIKNGVLLQENMKKQRYNLDDLFCQLRNNGIDSISEVEYAILEINGTLSIIKKDEAKTSYPFLLISDGEIIDEHLINSNITKDNLFLLINEQGYKNEKEIFLALLEKDKLLIVRKE